MRLDRYLANYLLLDDKLGFCFFKNSNFIFFYRILNYSFLEILCFCAPGNEEKFFWRCSIYVCKFMSIEINNYKECYCISTSENISSHELFPISMNKYRLEFEWRISLTLPTYHLKQDLSRMYIVHLSQLDIWILDWAYNLKSESPKRVHHC